MSPQAQAPTPREPATDAPGDATAAPAPATGQNPAEDMPAAGIGGETVADQASEEPDGSVLPGDRERWRGA